MRNSSCGTLLLAATQWPRCWLPLEPRTAGNQPQELPACAASTSGVQAPSIGGGTAGQMQVVCRIMTQVVLTRGHLGAQAGRKCCGHSGWQVSCNGMWPCCKALVKAQGVLHGTSLSWQVFEGSDGEGLHWVLWRQAEDMTSSFTPGGPTQECIQLLPSCACVQGLLCLLVAVAAAAAVQAGPAA